MHLDICKLCPWHCQSTPDMRWRGVSTYFQMFEIITIVCSGIARKQVWNHVRLTFREHSSSDTVNFNGHWSLMDNDAVSQTQSNLIKLVVPNVKPFPSVKKCNMCVVKVITHRMLNARISMSLNSDITIIYYQILLLQKSLWRLHNKWSNNESKSNIMIIFT